MNKKNITAVKINFLTVLIFIITIVQISAQPVINAKSAILIDCLTGAVLFEKNSQVSIPPASMTKLMSLYVVYKQIEEGKVSKEEIILISKNADFRALPPRSSLMFLEEGQEASMKDLMLGLAVSSGNDASIAIAERIAGSVEGFVMLMNLEARNMGLSSVYFDDASGLSDKNRVKAADFVQFCTAYITQFPIALKELHSVNSFTYPKEENWKTNGTSVYGPITQYNRNNLLETYDPVDGLKTGYIDESGYNIALTAKIDDELSGQRRLIAVILGGPGETAQEGSFLRAIDGINLLSYGFYNFRNVKSVIPEITPPVVWKGKDSEIKIEYSDIQIITLPVDKLAGLRTEVHLSHNIIAPIKKGEVLGEIYQITGEDIIARYPLTAAEDIEKGGFFRRLLDTIKIFFLKLSGDY